MSCSPDIAPDTTPEMDSDLSEVPEPSLAALFTDLVHLEQLVRSLNRALRAGTEDLPESVQVILSRLMGVIDQIFDAPDSDEEEFSDFINPVERKDIDPSELRLVHSGTRSNNPSNYPGNSRLPREMYPSGNLPTRTLQPATFSHIASPMSGRQVRRPPISLNNLSTS